jgi:hypothetical protein
MLYICGNKKTYTMEAIETIKKLNYKLEIFQDEDARSPREDDNLGTMVCFHRRYNLGDKHEYNSDNYSSWNEMKKAIQKDKTCVILPLYLYDHSGITISTKPFSCQWDSGQVGWIVVSKEKVRKEYGVKYITYKILDRVKRVLEAEVKTYDQYLTGDVYGYRISKITKCELGHEHEEELDSCLGFYGNEAEAEGISILNSYIKEVV